MPLPEGPRALFIYYRVSPARRAEALQAITALQQALLQRQPGLQARLWCRAEVQASDALEQTWMEVYEHPDGVDAQCEQWLQEQVQVLPSGLIGARHVEAFAPMDTRAVNTPTSEA